MSNLFTKEQVLGKISFATEAKQKFVALATKVYNEDRRIKFTNYGEYITIEPFGGDYLYKRGVLGDGVPRTNSMLYSLTDAFEKIYDLDFRILQNE